jgi:16S rRNA (cytosine967-C5)-methyltransferase
VNVRAAAAKVLGEVLERGQSLKGTLQKEQSRLQKEEDRAFLKEVVSGVVRQLPLLDWALDEVIERGLEATQPELLQILRVGAYQILFLDRVPAYAAVDECVEAAKGLNPGAGGFANGILRSLAENPQAVHEVPYRLDGVEALALRSGMPEWLVRRYERRFGLEETQAMVRALQGPASTSIVFASPSAAAKALPQLRREGIEAKPDPALPLTYHVLEGNPAKTAAFEDGLFYIMDPASQAPLALLHLVGDERVLDLCAAPGGKTALLSARLRKGGWVLATDVSRHRLAKVRENVGRLRLRNVRMALVDGIRGLPFGASWPLVLLDAPCTSLGTLRKNPEIRWQITPAAPAEMAAKQLSLLKEAARVTGPGGLLVYSVCSIEEEETAGVMAAFLEARPEFSLENLDVAAPWRGLLTPAGPGAFYLLPHRHGFGGFFVAALRKSAGR